MGHHVSCRGILSLCVARATQSVICRTLWRHNYEATRNCDTALHVNNTIDNIWVFFFTFVLNLTALKQNMCSDNVVFYDDKRLFP